MALTPPLNTPISDYGVSEDALIIVNMMDRLLERVVAIYEQQGVPLPARRYWMLGPEVPEDCEQVVVTFLQSYLGLPGDQAADAQNCNVGRTAVVNVFVTRNHPVGESGKAVAPERIIEASKWGAVDSAVLMWGLNELSAIEGTPGPGVIATVNVSPPNGGVQTTVLNLSVMIS